MHFYTQDFIGEFRYCAFPEITATEIRVKINTSRENLWEITEIVPKLVKDTFNSDFRVTAYVNIDKTYHPEDVDAGHFSVINNVNLTFGWFDREGNIFFSDETIDGNLISGIDVFEASLSNIRAKMKPGTNILVTLIGRDFSDPNYATVAVHTSAMTTYKEVFAANIATFLNTYSLDGVSFDYEYPENAFQNAKFLSFTSYLQDFLPEEKLVTAAVSAWGFIGFGLFSAAGEDIHSLDVMEVMTYDLGKSPNAYHSTFENGCYDTYKRITTLNNAEGNDGEVARLAVFGNKYLKVSLSQINLGLPFYSRPLGLEPYWGTYKNVAGELGKYNNLIDENITYQGNLLDLQYYNSYQMIYDKVAFALDKGLGGVMVWHYSCDTPSTDPLSLWGAIEDVILSRSPEV